MNKKRCLLLGSSGYIGTPLMQYLEAKGHEVLGIDNGFREKEARSITPVKKHPDTIACDVCNYVYLKEIIKSFNPDTIIHLAEIPAAPYSMIGQKEAYETQENNTCGSLNVLWAIKEVNPNIHLIKLGTAGEYPDWLYPDHIEIPEGSRIKVKNKDGYDWEIPTPRYFGSFYHASKFFDSYNCDYANRIWGLNITDINQAPVYGYIEGTRFDVDEIFGTVVNRFVAQAIKGYPLTVYGKGEQTRGFIHLKNSIEAIEIVLNERPEGFNIIHQLTETKTMNEIAELVQEHTGCKINHIENPRAEKESNKFNFEMKWLKERGLKPIYMKDSIGELIEQIKPYEENIREEEFEPKIKWK